MSDILDPTYWLIHGASKSGHLALIETLCDGVAEICKVSRDLPSDVRIQVLRQASTHLEELGPCLRGLGEIEAEIAVARWIAEIVAEIRAEEQPDA